MEELVLRNDKDGVAWLTLNRPGALNALSPNMFGELRHHIDQIETDWEDIGAVVLMGQGRSFSAGNDLKAIQRGERAPTPRFQAETLLAIEALPQPVIAAVRGHCFTGALELVLACDLLVASDTAKFSDTHGKWAMAPGWGMSQRLPRRIGPLKAKELMLTGRMVDGAEAVALGLANRVVADQSLEQAAADLAAEIVANSWHTLRADKMLVNRGQNYGLADGLQFEHDHNPGRGPDLEQRLKQFSKSE